MVTRRPRSQRGVGNESARNDRPVYGVRFLSITVWMPVSWHTIRGDRAGTMLTTIMTPVVQIASELGYNGRAFLADE